MVVWDRLLIITTLDFGMDFSSSTHYFFSSSKIFSISFFSNPIAEQLKFPSLVYSCDDPAVHFRGTSLTFFFQFLSLCSD